MKKIICLILAALMLLSLAACGAAKYDSTGDAFYSDDYYYSDAKSAWNEPAYEYPAAAEEAYYEEAYYEDGYYDDEYYDDGYYEEDYVGDGSEIPAETVSAPAPQDKIIYTAQANMETITFDQCVEDVNGLIADYGAYVESSSVDGVSYSNYYYKNQTYRSAYFTIRVPVERFTELLDALNEVGHVTGVSKQSQNVNAQYTDLQSRITAYETEEQALLDMLEMGETVSDLMEIQTRLAEVRREIEYYTSMLRGLDDRISYSTIELTVHEVREITETPPPVVPGYWEKIWNGFLSSLEDVGDFFTGLFSFLIRSFPVMLVLSIFFVLIPGLILLLIHKKKAKRAAKKAALFAENAPAAEIAPAEETPAEETPAEETPAEAAPAETEKEN